MFSSLFSTYAYASEGGMKAKRSYSEFTITILAYIPTFDTPGVSSGYGHACILLHNNSSIPMTVGRMLVMPGDYVSVGTFDLEHSPNENHAGVWYNVEGYHMRGISNYEYAAVSYDLTDTQVARLTNYINLNNRYVHANYTCASFAIGCWNAVVPSRYQLSTTSLPDILIHYIQDLRLPSTVLPSTSKDKDTIAYQTSTGVVYDSGTLNALMLSI